MRPTPRLLLAALVSLAVATPLWAQWRPLFGPPPAPCQPWAPGMPGPSGAPTMPGDTTGMGQPGAAPPEAADVGGRGAALASSSGALPGLVGGFGQRPTGAGPLSPVLNSGMRLLAGDSIVPMDRVYIAFTYTNGLIQDFHAFGGSRDIFNQFVELIGVEKTFFNNRASLTVRVPVSTLRAQPTPSESFALFNQGTGISTVVGDASIVLKVILFDNPERGNTIGAGVAASAPTTQTPFLGGSGNTIDVVRDTPDWVIEPYVGAIFRRGEFTFQTVT